MKNTKILGFIGFITFVFIAGCNNSGTATTQSTGSETGADQVVWNSVSSTDNPATSDTALNLNAISLLKINIFGFSGDVQLTYSPAQPVGTGILRLYTVSSDSSSLGWLTQNASNGELDVGANGTYDCNDTIAGGKITALQGSCYVKMLIILPSTAQAIHVYNAGALLTN